MIALCPCCDEPLLIDMPGQSDIEGFCARCCQTFNIDYCPWYDEEEGVIPGDPHYLDFYVLWGGWVQ